MTIWADADSLPRQVRELIGRRAGNSGVSLLIRAVFVANRKIPLPPGRNIQAITVGPAGASVPDTTTEVRAPAQHPGRKVTSADEYILSCAKPGDILVTRDIPLAAKAVDAGLLALNDRGTLWTTDTIRERLSVRDHLTALREAGMVPPPAGAGTFGQKEANAFANALDRAISGTPGRQPVIVSVDTPGN